METVTALPVTILQYGSDPIGRCYNEIGDQNYYNEIMFRDWST